MCDRCTAIHTSAKLKALKTHKVYTIEFRTFKLPQPRRRVPFEMYCADCNVLICLNCTVLTHRSHAVLSIPDAAVGKFYVYFSNCYVYLFHIIVFTIIYHYFMFFKKILLLLLLLLLLLSSSLPLLLLSSSLPLLLLSSPQSS